MSFDLQNKVYIVTGGSRGFGLAIAKNLVEQGARVGLISRNQSSLDAVVVDIGEEHVLGVAADVSSSAAVRTAFESIKAHFGQLDGLVNNAGLAMPNKVEDLVEEEFSL